MHILLRKFSYIAISFMFYYIIFILVPAFFNSDLYYKIYKDLPYANPIGIDLAIYLDFIRAWQEGNLFQFSYLNVYPPLCTLFLFPLVNLEHKTAYTILSACTIASFFIIGIVIPYLKNKSSETLVLSAFLTLLTFISYPFRFQLERGQLDIIMMMFCFLSILIFHQYGRKYVILSYVLFSFSIQIKLLSAIFVFTFFRQNDTVIKLLKRVLVLGAINIALTLSLGLDKSSHFFSSLYERSTGDSFIHELNTSVSSFFSLTKRDFKERFEDGNEKYAPIIAAIDPLKYVVYLMLIGGLFLGLYISFKNKLGGDFPPLLMICSLIIILLPQTSHDYKLPVLVTPLLYILTENFEAKTTKIKKILQFSLVFLFMSTFWYHKQGYLVFKMNTPALCLIYLICILLLFHFNGMRFIKNSKTIP